MGFYHEKIPEAHWKETVSTFLVHREWQAGLILFLARDVSLKMNHSPIFLKRPRGKSAETVWGGWELSHFLCIIIGLRKFFVRFIKNSINIWNLIKSCTVLSNKTVFKINILCIVIMANTPKYPLCDLASVQIWKVT